MNRNNTLQAVLSPEQRSERILDLLSTTGFSSVSDLARVLKVSEMTIRRDLDKLETEGHIRRTHGGAITESRTQIEIDYSSRKKRHEREKEKIGLLAANLVKSGQSVFVDAGTTTLAMAKYLKKLKNLRIITNSLPLQTELLDSNNTEVILIGGRILTHTMSLVGTLAHENLVNMRFDWTFLGTGGIDFKRGLTHSTMEEIPIKKAAAQSAGKVAVLADHTKFGYNALAFFMSIEEIDIIITDTKSEKQSIELKEGSYKTKILWP